MNVQSETVVYQISYYCKAEKTKCKKYFMRIERYNTTAREFSKLDRGLVATLLGRLHYQRHSEVK